MRIIFAACLFTLAAGAAETNAVPSVPVVAAQRWISDENETEQVWVDKMTDGTFRKSVIHKRPTVVRTQLIATNDVDFAWRFDYEAHMSDGTVETNAAFSPKTPKERLNKKIGAMKKTPPMPSTNVSDIAESIAKVLPKIHTQAAASIAQAMVVHKRRENKRPVSFMNDGAGKAVITYADRRTETQAIHSVVSARIPSPYAKEKSDKADAASGGGLAGTGAAALLAAAAGYAAGKKTR